MSIIAQALDISRSNLYDQVKKSTVRKRKTVDDSVNLSLIRQVTDERPSYGYRRVTAILRHRERRPINHKRVYRIMKENGLSLTRFDRRPTRAHEGKVITLLSNTRWCSDGFRIQCWNGEHVMVAFSLDYCDREVLSWVCSTRGIDGALIRDLMVQSMEYRFGTCRKLKKPFNGCRIMDQVIRQMRQCDLEEISALKS